MINGLKPKVYFISDTEQVIRRHRITLRRWWENDKFPKPILIGNRLAWQADVIDQWISENFGVSHD